jgi:hypothetical protein
MVPVRELGGDVGGHCGGLGDSSAEEISLAWPECRRVTLWQMTVPPQAAAAAVSVPKLEGGTHNREQQQVRRSQEAKGDAKGDAKGEMKEEAKEKVGAKRDGAVAVAEAKSAGRAHADIQNGARAATACVTRVPARLAGLPHHLPPLVLQDGQVPPHLRLQSL